MQQSPGNNRIRSKRQTRSLIFLILAAVFIIYIVLYPDYWIFSSIMAVLSMVGWLTNRTLTENEKKGNKP